MNIEDSRAKTIFRNDYNGKVYYKIGLSHKKQDGTYENGYMACRFQKDTNIQDKTKIMIIQAWLDFYTKDKQTVPYIFINKYEIAQDNIQDIPTNAKTTYEEGDVKLSDKDIDNIFGKQEEKMELPF